MELVSSLLKRTKNEVKKADIFLFLVEAANKGTIDWKNTKYWLLT